MSRKQGTWWHNPPRGPGGTEASGKLPPQSEITMGEELALGLTGPLCPIPCVILSHVTRSQAHCVLFCV
jgi:hypothetical protein